MTLGNFETEVVKASSDIYPVMTFYTYLFASITTSGFIEDTSNIRPRATHPGYYELPDLQLRSNGLDQVDRKRKVVSIRDGTVCRLYFDLPFLTVRWNASKFSSKT